MNFQSRIIGIFVLLTWFISPSQAQSTASDIRNVLQAYNSVNSIGDDNERIYQLSLLSKQWVELLQRNDFEYPDTSSNQLKRIFTIDEKFAVYYFVPFIKIGQPRIELFITRNDSILPNAFSYSEPLNINPMKVETEVKNIEPVINNIKTETTECDELQFIDSKTHEVLMHCADVELKYLFEQMANVSDFNMKRAVNRQIGNKLSMLLSDKNTFNNQFAGIRRLSTLISEDKLLKICTWNIEHDDMKNDYFGFVVVRKNDESLKVHNLIDASETIKQPEKSVLTTKKWFGAIYYDLIETTYKERHYYTLLGFKADNEFSKMKLIDELIVDQIGAIKFGSNIFNKNPNFVNRLIYEYSSSANMMLKYDKERKMIVMDNLAPSNSSYKGIYRFYGPDFSYNGLKFEKGKWMYYPDLDLRNPKEEKKTKR